MLALPQHPKADHRQRRVLLEPAIDDRVVGETVGVTLNVNAAASEPAGGQLPMGSPDRRGRLAGGRFFLVGEHVR